MEHAVTAAPIASQATPGDEADEARAQVEAASGTSPVLQPAPVNESYPSPTIEGIDALPSQHAGSGPEEHHPGRYDPESNRPGCTADQAPGFRAQVFDMTSGSTKLDIQTDDDARSCTPSLPSMVSEWQVIDDRQRLERFLLPAEDVGAFGYRVLPDWSDPDGKCSTSFDKTVQQWLSERLKGQAAQRSLDHLYTVASAYLCFRPPAPPKSTSHVVSFTTLRFQLRTARG